MKNQASTNEATVDIEQVLDNLTDTGAVVENHQPAKRRGRSSTKSVEPLGGNRAVIYLRVSQPKQTETDYDPEGLSLPAQRKACLRKAESMGLVLAEDGEYVEPGKTGTEMTRRDEFQKMLKRIKEQKDVSAVIVYKLSRLARNRLDEAIVMNQLNKYGVRLISATEPIDNTPEGQFMQGILSSMNQFRSQQDGAIISYNLAEKAKKGGTIGRTPIGYLNVKETIDGREISTVIVDPVRAPFIQLAFRLYVEGKTIAAIAEILADRGMLTRPTKRYPAGALSDCQLHRLLHDPYYTGMVRYKGDLYPGRHEAIISQKLFDEVQALLDSRGVTTSRYRVYDHPLKGLVYCGECKKTRDIDRRMVLQKADGNGGRYWYYFCSGHVDHLCNSPFVNIVRVEDAVAEYYKTLALRPAFITLMRESLGQFLDETSAAEQETRQQLEAKLKALELRESKLIELAIDDSLPRDVIHSKLAELGIDREKAKRELASIAEDFKTGVTNMETSLSFLSNPASLYRRLHGDSDAEKLLHTALFEKIYIHQEDITDTVLTAPLQELKQLERQVNLGNVAGQTAVNADKGTVGGSRPERAHKPEPSPNSPHTATSGRTRAKPASGSELESEKVAQTGNPEQNYDDMPFTHSCGLSKEHMAEDTRFELVRA